MWLKLLLLTLYLVFLFILCRVLETVSWYNNTGTLLTSFVVLDPIALSVKKLKELLDNRGISYSGVVEKHELVDLVNSSGKVTREELIDALFPSNKPPETHFTCGSHFYEEVEDTKDSAWLVNVIVDSSEPTLITEQTWEDIKQKAGSYGVRNGVFKCSLDRRLCQRKGWTTSRLILALPRGKKAKEDVVLHNHVLPSTTGSILQWVRKHLSSSVTEIKTDEELEEWMIYSELVKKSEIRILFFSFLNACPMFLSAIAIKFNGRVKIGFVDVTSVKSYKKYINSEDPPSYLAITSEKTFTYGARRGECYNIKSMELYLRTFVPEMNDVFLWSLLVVNALAAFELFYSYSCFWKHFFLYAVCVVKYNFILFLLWLLILALYRFPVIITCTELALKCLRYFSGSYLATILRNDYKSFYSNSFLLFTFCFFAIVSGYLLKKFKWLQPNEESTLFSSFRPISMTRRIPLREMDMEIDMDLFIERLAVPNLWLQPVISMDYVKNLPMWKYRGWCEADDEVEQRKDLLLSSDDENVNRLHVPFDDKPVVPDNMTLTENKSSYREDDTSSQLKGSPTFPLNSGTNPFSSSHWQYNSSKKFKATSQELRAPKGMLELRECSICLENYQYEEYLCGLPCGHNFHMNCIMVWLTGDNHCCPICRRPSYRFENLSHHLHTQ